MNSFRQQGKELSLYRDSLLDDAERRSEAERLEAIRQRTSMRTDLLARFFGRAGSTSGSTSFGFFR